MKCPTCKGTGKVKTEVVEVDGKKNKTTTMNLTCYTCSGIGTVTPERYFLYQKELAMWCRCGNPSGDVNFYNDGMHPEISKHHYRCADCGKVTQIG